jgi:hypothetical protein
MHLFGYSKWPGINIFNISSLLCPFKAYVNLLEIVTGDTDSPVMAIPRVGSGKDNITPLTKSSVLPLFNNLLVGWAYIVKTYKKNTTSKVYSMIKSW